MLRQALQGLVLTALFITLASGAPARAQTPSGERAQGVARNLLNLAGFAGQCVDKQLLDEKYVRSAQFGGYLGGFVLGSLYGDQGSVQTTANSYVMEGLSGRVHEFNDEGTLMAYDVEFTKENCKTLADSLQATYDKFSKSVLEGS